MIRAFPSTPSSILTLYEGPWTDIQQLAAKLAASQAPGGTGYGAPKPQNQGGYPSQMQPGPKPGAYVALFSLSIQLMSTDCRLAGTDAISTLPREQSGKPLGSFYHSSTLAITCVWISTCFPLLFIRPLPKFTDNHDGYRLSALFDSHEASKLLPTLAFHISTTDCLYWILNEPLPNARRFTDPVYNHDTSRQKVYSQHLQTVEFLPWPASV